jgi:hypothetical protein
MFVSVLHYTNKNILVKSSEEPLSLISSNGFLFNIPFFVLSGMMTCNVMLKGLNRDGKINVLKEYLGRYLRCHEP